MAKSKEHAFSQTAKPTSKVPLERMVHSASEHKLRTTEVKLAPKRVKRGKG